MKIDSKNIELKYGDVQALNGVTIWGISNGEIQALIGPNGSGKSSFLKCLSGHVPKNLIKGTLLIDGNNVLSFWDRWTAYKTGFRFTTQEPILVNDLTTIENIVLGIEQRKLLFLWNRGADYNRVQRLMKETKLYISLDKPGIGLTAAEKQKVGILRALFGIRENGFLLLDEPTTQLTEEEMRDFLSYLQHLKNDKNIGIIIVTHHVSDIMKYADKITIFRDGCVINTFDKSEFNKKIIPLLGISENRVYVKPNTNHRSTIFTAHLKISFRYLVYEIRLSVQSGEITFVYTPEEELIEDFFKFLGGLATTYLWNGDVNFKQISLSGKNNWERRDLGIGYVSADKSTYGVFEGMSIYENIILERNAAFTRIFSRRIRRLKREILDKMIHENHRLDDDVMTLSGGYKQLLILEREWAQNPKLLILRNPTQGLDSEKRQIILHKLHEFTAYNDGAVLILGTFADNMGTEGAVQINYIDFSKFISPHH